MILGVTFAIELIIVKLLNSLASVKPTFCGADEKTGQSAKCTAAATHWDRELLREKQVQQHLYSEQASGCVCDLYVVMCASYCLQLGRMRKYVTYGPSYEAFNVSEALQRQWRKDAA